MAGSPHGIEAVVRRIAGVVLTIAALGCADTAGPNTGRLPPPSMTGTWAGTVHGNRLTFTLVQDNQALAGTLDWVGRVAVSGTYVFPNVTLTTSMWGLPLGFAGTMTDPHQIRGALSGMGDVFKGDSLILIQQ